MAGLQDTVRSQNVSFNRIAGPYIQIAHVNGNHWVTLEGAHGSMVRVYDSKYQYISESTQKIISCMTMPDRNYIDVHIQNTQKQSGSSDCGLYAIAFAVELCFGNNPASFRYASLNACTYYNIYYILDISRL